MNTTQSRRRRILQGWGLSLAAALGICGCGNPATVIEGIVSLDGQPVPNASLEFFPVSGKGRVSFTKTDATGRYRVAVWPTPLKSSPRRRRSTERCRTHMAPTGR
jgi:hypothetical protein